MIKTLTIYLAGPIFGCTADEANDWRVDMDKSLRGMDIRGVSPLRCEPIIGDRYQHGYADPKFGTARAIGSKNMFDVQSCDLTLAYLPTPPEGRPQSYGTLIELGWAHALDKPTIVVTDDPMIFNHPVVGACAGWLLGTLDEAVAVIEGIFGGYTPNGKNI